MSSAFPCWGQLLSQVTSSLIYMEEVGKRLLSGTFGYFGGTERQVAVEGKQLSLLWTLPPWLLTEGLESRWVAGLVVCSTVLSRPPKEAEVHSAAPEIVAPQDSQSTVFIIAFVQWFCWQSSCTWGTSELGGSWCGHGIVLLLWKLLVLYCTDLWAKLSPWVPQAACSLQDTEDTTTERKRAGSWERDCKRVRAPAHWGTAELSVGHTTAGVWQRVLWQGSQRWGEWCPQESTLVMELLVTFPLRETKSEDSAASWAKSACRRSQAGGAWGWTANPWSSHTLLSSVVPSLCL